MRRVEPCPGTKTWAQEWAEAPVHMYVSRKKERNIFRVGVFLISLGGQALHVRPMGRTCGEPNKQIELATIQL